MWILPTKDRPENLRRFANSAREMGTSSPGLVVVNQDDWDRNKDQYEEIRRLLPPLWRYAVVRASTYGEAVRAVWPVVKDLEWIGLVCDDLLPVASKWDTALLSSLNGWNVVSSNDGWQASADIRVGRMHGAIAWSGDLARTVGWIFPDGLDHIFHDDVWETLGRETGCWTSRMDIMVRHLHEALDGTIGPTMNRESALWKHDEAWFVNWMAEEKHQVVARIEALKTAKGVQPPRAVDLVGVNLFIATPSHSGTYEGSFMESLYATTQALAQASVPVTWIKQQYTADIALARAKLFATFAKSDATHMLMVDADMGWSVDAVLRLFLARKDMVAVAGPKKRYPLQFAANHTDAAGNPLDLQFDPTSMTVQVSEVGAAFMLITKAVAERLIAAYGAECEYISETGESEWGVFIPMVRNRRYYSEDFAFCKRWTMIGGELHLCPDIPLKHTGTHQFEGALQQTMQSIPRVDDLHQAPLAQQAAE